MLLPHKRLSKSVCRHLCYWTPLYLESSLLYLLPHPHLMSVHMPQLCVKPFVFLLNNPARLLIVAVDLWLDLWIKLDMLEDAGPLLHLSTCS
jgi:hypothetical protein